MLYYATLIHPRLDIGKNLDSSRGLTDRDSNRRMMVEPVGQDNTHLNVKVDPTSSYQCRVERLKLLTNNSNHKNLTMMPRLLLIAWLFLIGHVHSLDLFLEFRSAILKPNFNFSKFFNLPGKPELKKSKILNLFP